MKGSREKIQDRVFTARSVRRSARSTQVERALRARFGLWIFGRDTSGVSIQFFTASGGLQGLEIGDELQGAEPLSMGEKK